MPERLHRLDETFIDFPIYFVTASTHTHQRILSDPDVHNRFIQFAEEGESHGAWIGVRDNPVRAELVKKWRDWPFAGEIFDLEYRRGAA